MSLYFLQKSNECLATSLITIPSKHYWETRAKFTTIIIYALLLTSSTHDVRLKMDAKFNLRTYMANCHNTLCHDF